MNSQLPDKKKAEVLTVYDAENDIMYESTPERQHWANEVQGAILFGTFISAMKLAEMINNRLYLDLGFISRDDYIENGFPLGRRQAYKLLKIHKRYAEALPDIEKRMLNSPGEEVQSSVLNGEVHSSALPWNALGITKLYELSRIEDDDLFKGTIKTGSLTTPDGRELTIDDIREMSSRQFAEEIKDIRNKFQTRLHTTEEENSKLKSEIATIRREFAKDTEKYARLKLVEEKFSGAANKLEDKKEYLEKAYDYLGKFNHLMEAANIEESDPEELIRLIQMIIQAEQTYTARIVTRYRSIVHDILDRG